MEETRLGGMSIKWQNGTDRHIDTSNPRQMKKGLRRPSPLQGRGVDESKQADYTTQKCRALHLWGANLVLFLQPIAVCTTRSSFFYFFQLIILKMLLLVLANYLFLVHDWMCHSQPWFCLLLSLCGHMPIEKNSCKVHAFLPAAASALFTPCWGFDKCFQVSSFHSKRFRTWALSVLDMPSSQPYFQVLEDTSPAHPEHSQIALKQHF
jgi:hypothetical protein